MEVEAGKRYYVVSLPPPVSGANAFGLVEGIPSDEEPDNPGKDGRSIEILIDGVDGEFWRAVNLAGIVWTSSNFKRFWEYAPMQARRTREMRV